METVKKEIVQAYGFEKIFLIDNLIKIGLLKKKGEEIWPDMLGKFDLIKYSATCFSEV